MSADSDRTWPLPSRPWMLRMTWSELLFAHWAIEPSGLSPLLPAGLELDTRDGMAWIGVVPFLMSDVAPRCCPAVRGLSRFLELNVRTYVTLDGKPGVWFFSLDAANRVAVRLARRTFNLPYMDAEMNLESDAQGVLHYCSRRTHRGEPLAQLDAKYKPSGGSFRARPGSLEHWLTARYCLYSADRQGQIYRGEIDHPPWDLHEATWSVRDNTMTEPLGIDAAGPAHLLFARSIQVHAWLANAISERA